MNVYYLPFGDNDDEDRHKALSDLRFRIQYDDHLPTQQEFEEHYEYQGNDPDADLDSIFSRWNAGSGRESAAFARRECQDCDAAFDGVTATGVKFGLRQYRAEKHEADTDHTVGHGHRSMSAGDIVVTDDTAYLVATAGFKELPDLEVD